MEKLPNNWGDLKRFMIVSYKNGTNGSKVLDKKNCI